MSAAFASTIPNSRTIKALVKRLLRPLVLRIRWMAARLDIGGAADAERARRGVLSLTAALATLEVTLAEQAETSRFNQLQSLMQTELEKLSGDMEQSKSLLLNRLEQIERDLRAALEQTGNSLAAYIGELEDRFDSSLGKSK